jgi:hypothetical protein
LFVSKTTRVHKVQKYYFSENAETLRLDCESVSFDVPYGDCFKLVEKWIVTKTENGCRLQVFFASPFSKSVMLQALITSRTKSEFRTGVEMWVATAVSYIQPNAQGVSVLAPATLPDPSAPQASDHFSLLLSFSPSKLLAYLSVIFVIFGIFFVSFKISSLENNLATLTSTIAFQYSVGKNHPSDVHLEELAAYDTSISNFEFELQQSMSVLGCHQYVLDVLDGLKFQICQDERLKDLCKQ